MIFQINFKFIKWIDQFDVRGKSVPCFESSSAESPASYFSVSTLKAMNANLFEIKFASLSIRSDLDRYSEQMSNPTNASARHHCGMLDESMHSSVLEEERCSAYLHKKMIHSTEPD